MCCAFFLKETIFSFFRFGDVGTLAPPFGWRQKNRQRKQIQTIPHNPPNKTTPFVDLLLFLSRSRPPPVPSPKKPKMGGGVQDIIWSVFGPSCDLYSIFSLTRSSFTPSALKKSYRRLALTCHPDKVPPGEREEATGRFQAVTGAYGVLGDEGRRGWYDESGEIDDGEGGIGGGDGDGEGGEAVWREYFEAVYKRVTSDLIDGFACGYKGSEEERGDVLKWYRATGGDLGRMVECVMLSGEGDKARWVDEWILPAVEKGELRDEPKMREFLETKAYKEKGKEKEKEEDAGGEGGKGKGKKKRGRTKVSSAVLEELESEDLMRSILGKKTGAAVAKQRTPFDKMISDMENRYGGDNPPAGAGAGGSKRSKKGGKAKGKGPEDIDDD